MGTSELKWAGHKDHQSHGPFFQICKSIKKTVSFLCCLCMNSRISFMNCFPKSMLSCEAEYLALASQLAVQLLALSVTSPPLLGLQQPAWFLLFVRVGGIVIALLLFPLCQCIFPGPLIQASQVFTDHNSQETSHIPPLPPFCYHVGVS